ncbi:hypothetical protein CDV55_103388 [Aspergillus turcosus]|nr:hypothetical protein CDV55_103388 [Aspergillus turcosus]
MAIEDILSSTGTSHLSQVDRHLISKWNSTLHPRLDVLVHDLIEQQCAALPLSPAVCAWDGNFTYTELANLSTRLAVRLVELGATPGSFVPILTEKSRWVVVAILAILKAGAAFVLLDYSHPPERLRTICQTVGAELILTSFSCTEQAMPLASNTVVIENLVSLKAPADQSHYDKGPEVTPSSPLYAVFTSGTTGAPKGIVVSHAAYSTSAAACNPAMKLKPSSRVYQFSSYAFDISISDHLLTLITGACICIPSESDRRNRLSASMEQFRVNWAVLTPSVARMVHPGDVPTLEHLHMAGEAICQTDLEQWSGHVNLLSLYGPAEVAIGVTVNPDLHHADSPTNLGVPFAVNCWVVDPDDPNRLVPIGEEGVLVCEGHTLSDGYIGRSSETSAVFMQPPLWLSASRKSLCPKMYQTGDIVRQNRDGTLQYIGRKDLQVKLRGQRIELGEVEHQIRLCLPSLREVTVELVRIGDRPPRLAAFLVFDWQEETEFRLLQLSEARQQELRKLQAQLTLRLAPFMVPNLFFAVTKLPMTTSGKTDRRHLRDHVSTLTVKELAAYQGGKQEPKEPPIGTNECELQNLWAQVLKLPLSEIGRHDSWFQLGGDSLLAMRLIGTAQERGIFFSVQDLAHYRTVAAVAKVMSREEQTAGEELPFRWLGDSLDSRQRLVRLVTEQYDASGKEVVDIYPGTEIVRCACEYAANTNDNHTLLIECDLPPTTDLKRLSQAWDHVVQTHFVLRSEIVQVDGDCFQVVLKNGVPLEFPNAAPTGEQIEDLWGLKKPLVRLMVVRNRLSMLIHHVVYDGYSLALIFEHLFRAYNGESLPVHSFDPYLNWVSNVHSDVDEFWKNMFANCQAKAFPPLPDERHEPREDCHLEPRRIDLSNAPSEFTTDKKLHLSLAVTIALQTNDTDVVFTSNVNRRGAPVPHISETAYPILTGFPTRVQLSATNTITETLDALQKQLLDSIAFQNVEIPYLAKLGPEMTAACQMRTVLLVQPSIAQLIPDMFANWHYTEPQDYVLGHGLYVECDAFPNSVNVKIRYDQNMLPTREAQKLLDHLVSAFVIIDQQPSLTIQELLDTVVRSC